MLKVAKKQHFAQFYCFNADTNGAVDLFIEAYLRIISSFFY